MRSRFTVSLPEELHEYVLERSRRRGDGTVSSYFRHLIRLDKRQEEENRITSIDRPLRTANDQIWAVRRAEIIRDGLRPFPPIDTDL